MLIVYFLYVELGLWFFCVYLRALLVALYNL